MSKYVPGFNVHFSITFMRRALLASAILMVAVQSGQACAVPVYRYALERWAADEFQAVIVHPGGLSPVDEALARKMSELGGEENPARPNVQVHTLDAGRQPDDPVAVAFQPEIQKGLPRLLLLFPARAADPGSPGCSIEGGLCPVAPASSAEARLAWAGPWSGAAAEAVLDSPVRKELGRLLLRGDSVVWILVESGLKERDEAAATLLQAELRKQEVASYQAATAAAADPEEADPEAEAPIRVAFPVLRLSRGDPAEQVFLSMLLNTESDLQTYADQPIVFPVFGRGRVLYALVGRGIQPNHIAEACEFLTGPCSCEVKDQNPGTDLLLSLDWEHIADGRFLSEEPLPPLTGLSPDAPAAPEAGSPARDAKPAGEAVAPDGRGILRRAGMTLGAMAFGLALLGFILLRRQGAGGGKP
jgi:hypothetical protein